MRPNMAPSSGRVESRASRKSASIPGPAVANIEVQDVGMGDEDSGGEDNMCSFADHASH